MDRKYLQECLSKWKTTHAALMDAYLALVKGGVKSYMIDDRQLTRFDLPTLRKQIDEAEEKIAELEAALNNKRPRKAFAVLPREW